MRINHEQVADRDLIQRHIDDFRVALSMRERRHAFDQRAEDGRSAAQSVIFQRLPAREHEDNDRAGEIFVEQDRGDDGNAGQEIGSKLSSQKFLQQFINERNATEREDREQGEPGCCGVRAKAKSQNQMNHNAGHGEKSDQRRPASRDFYRLFPKTMAW